MCVWMSLQQKSPQEKRFYARAIFCFSLLPLPSLFLSLFLIVPSTYTSMEVFDSTIFANDDDDQKNFINNYASLSQFDLDLQQQAQAAMQQGTWQDFDMFLPQLDCPNLFYNAPITPPHAFPTPSPPQRPIEQTNGTTTTTTTSNNMPLFDTTFMDDATTLYSQATSLLPNNMIPAVSEADNNGSIIKQQQMPISPPLVSFDTTPVVPSQWSDPEPKPEPIGSSSPILSENVAMSTTSDNEQRHITPPPDISGPPPLPLPQSTSSPSTTLPTQQQQWNTTEATNGMCNSLFLIKTTCH